MPRRHSDPLFRISYGIFSVKFVIAEIVFAALSIFGLYELIQIEINHASSPPASISAPAPSETSPAERATPPKPIPKSNASAPVIEL